jgi:putative DNA primase/helicase
MADINGVQAALVAEGFNPTSIDADGKIHRFKKDSDDKGKSGWYVCHQNHSDKGELFFVAVWGDWHNQDQEFKFISEFTQTKFDREKIQKQLEAAEKKRKLEQARVWEETSAECTKRWEGFSENPECKYLQDKGLDQLFGAKTQIDPSSNSRALYVPVRDLDQKIWGFQKLQGDGQKFFFPGTKKASNFHIIGGSIENEEIIYLAEGFATAASVHLAIRKPVVVCFDAGNLLPVGEAIRKRYKSARFVVCGDDDQFTEKGNAGREKAEAAAKAILGKAVFPVFKQNPDRLTDFNDLHRAEGLDPVRNQILEIKPEVYRILTLGHQGDNYFYISSSNQQIVTISQGGHSKNALLNLMPLEYWQSQYPSKMGVDWDGAVSELMKACRTAGVFQPERVRGVGVWLDNGRVMINIGNAVHMDGHTHQLNSVPSKYTYEIGNKIPAPCDNPLTVEESRQLVTAIKIMRWKKPEFAHFMAGWIAVAPLAGALQWRPHVWLTAPAGSGKSWFMQYVVNRIFGNNRFFFQGNTTEAGIRQSIGSDARAVIFDEFETDDDKSAERIQTILELVRQASSESDGMVVKGGAGGKATQYRIRFCGFFTSVRLNLEREQDKTRFTNIELLRVDGDKKGHFTELKRSLEPITEDYGARLFSRLTRMLPTILENERRFRLDLAERYNARFGQQYGTLLAGYAALVSDDVLTPERIEQIVDDLNLTEESETVSDRDESECVDYLVKKVVSTDLLTNGRSDRSIGELIRAASFATTEAQIYQEALMRIGLRVQDDHLWIANSHPSLKAIFRGTKWTTGWKKPLSRVNNAVNGKLIRFGAVVSRCTGIPLHAIFDGFVTGISQ